MKRVGGGLLVQTPDNVNVSAAASQGGHPGQADAGAAGGPAVCLARRQIRQIQRHRVLRRRPDAGRGRRADEPRGLGADRLDQGGECRAALAGSVVASDAFFPFRDGVDVVAQAGAGRSFSPAAACATKK